MSTTGLTYVKNSGSWWHGNPYAKHAGTWKPARSYAKHAGTWKPGTVTGVVESLSIHCDIPTSFDGELTQFVSGTADPYDVPMVHAYATSGPTYNVAVSFRGNISSTPFTNLELIINQEFWALGQEFGVIEYRALGNITVYTFSSLDDVNIVSIYNYIASLPHLSLAGVGFAFV
jgi:hypothetical protein